MMNPIDNNQFEVRSAKRKVITGPNVYLNPALDLLANEDPMCNTAMEVTPNKRRRQTTSNIAAFENTALDLGISKAAVNEFLAKELHNVHKNVRAYEIPIQPAITNDEPVYANLTDTPPLPSRNRSVEMPTMDNCHINDSTGIDSGISLMEQKSSNGLENNDLSVINKTTNIQTNVTNQVFINNSSNLNLSFIDRLALDSPQPSNQSLYLDDDLNESNIMEIKTITIITKKKIVPLKNTNPFLDTNVLETNLESTGQNPFLDDVPVNEIEYNEEALNRPMDIVLPNNNLQPRRLFVNDTNSTISTVNEHEHSLSTENNEYENVEFRSESPIYENIDELIIDSHYNKQSKILGHDVSKFNAIDIMNLNKMSQANNSTESNDSKKHLKHHLLKASNKLSKKVFKTLKKTFKSEKLEPNTTLNPYEVPRKPAKEKIEKKDVGIENPALKLDNSDDIEIEELCENEDEQYETIKTIRNTRLNENVTPLRESCIDNDSHNKTNTPSKKVRFDSTLNREKIITGDSFDCDIQSPGFDAKIDKYHDELENCINEQKFIQQNM